VSIFSDLCESPVVLTFEVELVGNCTSVNDNLFDPEFLNGVSLLSRPVAGGPSVAAHLLYHGPFYLSNFSSGVKSREETLSHALELAKKSPGVELVKKSLGVELLDKVVHLGVHLLLEVLLDLIGDWA